MNERRWRVAMPEESKMAARNLLSGARSAGNEETRNTLVAKFPPKDYAAMSAAAAAVLAPPRWKMEVPPCVALTTSTLPSFSSTSSVPAARSQVPKRRPMILPLEIHYPHRQRDGGVRDGHDSLLAETR